MSNLSTRSIIFRVIALIIIDAFALNLVVGIGTQYSVPLAIGILIGTLIINFVFIFDRFSVWRWTAPGLALMALLVVYPLINTVFVSLTNYGDGHLGTRDEVLNVLAQSYYKPKDAVTFKPSIFISNTPSNPAQGKDFVLWLVDPAGKAFVGSLEKGIVAEADAEAQFGKLGERSSAGIPATIGNFNQVARLNALRFVQVLKDQVAIRSGAYLVRVESLDSAPQLVQRFEYNATTGDLLDRESGTKYKEERGTFVTLNERGETVTLQGVGGWAVNIGAENFTRAITSESVRGPFFSVFIWTVVFAITSVFTTFALGLLFAIILNTADIPFRGLFRTLLVIPYALPAFISVLIWRGLLQPEGLITSVWQSLFHVKMDWFGEAWLARIAILAVNLWLGYPYMMIISMGALQSIPSDLYEAAVIDGANYWAQFRRITLPLLMVTVGPLLIGSFAFNFNNFAIIQLLTQGGPKPDAAAVAGQTDILISYTYRLAFAGTKGIDYGFASALTLFIFLIVAGVTVYNFRLSRRLEQVYSNG